MKTSTAKAATFGLLTLVIFLGVACCFLFGVLATRRCVQRCGSPEATFDMDGCRCPETPCP